MIERNRACIQLIYNGFAFTASPEKYQPSVSHVSASVSRRHLPGPDCASRTRLHP